MEDDQADDPTPLRPHQSLLTGNFQPTFAVKHSSLGPIAEEEEALTKDQFLSKRFCVMYQPDLTCTI